MSAFIAIEGMDGCGKTTIADGMSATIRAMGLEVLRTAEPSDGAVGQLIRQGLRGQERFDPRTLALLFAADRVEHCRDVVSPAVRQGKVVLCDRFIGSSLAFQAIDGDGLLTEDWLLRINAGALVPDASILLDLPPEAAATRMRERGGPPEKFEVLDVMTRVRARYLDLFKRAPKALGNEVYVVDASQSRHAVEALALRRVMPLLFQAQRERNAHGGPDAREE